MYQFSFERLDVWQKSRELAKAIYQITKDFPPDERFGLTSQIRRAAISVSSNIAEGCSRHQPKDKSRFTEIAYGSLLEVLNQLILSADVEILTVEKVNEIRPLIEEIGNKLNKLRESQLKG